MSSQLDLAGSPYRAIQLPNFSNRRRHSGVYSLFNKTTLDEHLRNVNNTTLDAIVLVAYANMLGMYCETTDVLLSLECSDGTLAPFRLQWDETMAWETAIEEASTALRQLSAASPVGIPSQPPEVFEPIIDHLPFLAFFRDSSRTTSSNPASAVPAVLSSQLPLLIHTGNGSLHLHSSSNQFCSSMASMFLHQIVAVTAKAFADTTQKIAAPLHLDNNLSSVVEALPEPDRATYYSHIRPARLATDYILPHSTSNPNAIAVQWYPDLSPDTVMFRTPECLSYGDLNHTANRFARFLLEKGLCREDRIAVCMDRDLMFHSVLFGILRAGGCYVPIDPELPTQRKLFIARDSLAKYIVTSSRSQPHDIFGESSIDICDVITQETIFSMSDAEVDPVLPGDLAYMLYTSGTIGNPKGCLITHNGLSEAILALTFFTADVKMADIRKGKYLAVASMAFDVHLAEIFVSLALGMTLVSAKREELLENLPLYINLLEITHVGLVPSLIDATMCVVQDNRKQEEIKLRYISSGGEKITDSILDKWGDHPVVRLANFYGPSEVTIGCCARFMDGNIPRENIGRAFANVSSYVVDNNLDILPRGVVGELVVAGPLVGRGYHELPDLTVKFFMEWPRKGSWSYRTGDLVRMLPDGTLHIIGRIDTQVKLRGVRIEVEGISAVFRNTALSELGLQLNVGTIVSAHPSIGNGATPQLVTFITWDIQVPISVRQTSKPRVLSFQNNVLQILRTISERELASYMRPAHIIRLSWLPLSPNGKTDDKTLSSIFKEIDLQHLIGVIHDTSAENCTLLTDVQQQLVSLVENHAQISPIDLRTSLFAYGMDSLSLIKLVSDIKRTLLVSITVADVMKAGTIKAVGELIQTRPLQSPASSSVIKLFSEQWLRVVEESVPHIQVGHVLPPFPIQEGVLYHSDSHPASCVQHVIMSISDQTPLSRVRDAWETTMKKLDILRTVFYFGRQLVQVVRAPTNCQLPWVEQRTPFTDADSFCAFFYAEMAPSLAQQINGTTSTTPPFRLVVFSPPGNHHGLWLTLSIHHALFDGTSLPLILKFVEDEFLERPHPATCSPESLLEYMHSAKDDVACRFWAAWFSDFSWSGQRLTRRPSNQTRRKLMPLTTSLATLRKLLIPHQVTMQSAVTCAFAFSLARYIHHTDDVAFVVIRTGRLLPVEGAEHAICPTVSVLPTRIRLDTGDYLQRVQADISAAAAFEHFPLSRVQKWLPPGIAPFDTLFAVTVKDDVQYEAWDIPRSELPETDFPLSVEILLDESNDSLTVRAAYYDSGSLAVGVDNIFHQFEAILLDILTRESRYVAPSTRVTQCINQVQPTIQTYAAADDDSDELGDGLNAHDLIPLKETVSNFFGLPSERLHPDTSFISLGLDSIQSVGLSRVLRQHGYFLKAADIMGNQNLRKLAVLCARSFGHSAQVEIKQGIHSLQKQREEIMASLDPSSCKLSIEDEVEIFPTTALQTGMISQTVASAGSLYFHSFVLDLNSDTDLTLLKNAWDRAVCDIDILRTTFHYVAELASWVQARHSVVKLDWQECVSTPPALFQHTVGRLFSHLKPKDEAAFRSPPMHLRVLRPEPAGLYLVLFMHHALYDGLSIPSLLSHVEHIYQNQEVARPAQFFDFIPRILSQQDHATAYWAERLQNYHPVTSLRQTSLSSKAIVASRLVPVQQQSLVQLVHDNAVTLQCLAQAVWAKYLASLDSLNDVVFGHVVSGRSFDDSEYVVGPILNTIPCRIQFSPHMSNRELIQSIHRANVNALPWQHVSLRAVQNKLQLHSLLSSLLLFQPLRLPVHSNLWALRDLEEFDVQVQYPLNIEFHEVETGFLIKMACRSDVMDSETLNSVLADIDALINEMVYHLDIPATTATNVGMQQADVAKVTERPENATCIPPELLATLALLVHCPADNLFPSQSLVAIGVDSITAISLSAKCKKVGLAISVGDIISSSTIGELASKAGKTNPDIEALQSKSPLLEITAEERQAIINRFPDGRRHQIVSVAAATEGMKWLIAAWQRSCRQRFYHVFAYKLSPNVQLQRLQNAWKVLMAHHPILRSTFASAPGRFDPRVVTFALDSVEADLTEEYVEHGQDLPALAEKMKTVLMSPLPISSAQMKGSILTLTSTNNRYLLVRMHHFQYDAISLQLLLEDLTSIYLGSSPQNTSDTSAFLAAYTPSLVANLSEQRLYWQSVIPIPFLPRHLPSLTAENRPPSAERILVTVASAIPGATELKKQAQAVGLPLHCILLASWASVQASNSSSNHATFGLWHAGRTGSVPNVLNLAAPCMNVLPVYILVSDSLLEVARQVQRDLRRRTPVVQQSSLRDIDEWITGGKGLPLTNVFLNVFEIARADRRENELFTSVEIGHTIPAEPPVFSEESEVIDTLPITKLLQDDVMVDIVINERLDAITMSIESARAIMDAVCAKEIIEAWAMGVKRSLSSSSEKT